MSLATSGLPVCEHGTIIALQDMFDKRVRGFTVDMCLLGAFREDSIIGKTFDVVRLCRFGEIDLVVILVDGNYSLTPTLLLRTIERPNTDDDFNTFAHSGRLL